MAFCKIADILYDAVPLRLLRDMLIRGHMERCPHCQTRLIGPEEAKGLLVASDRVGDDEVLWRRISAEAGRVVAAPVPKQGRAVIVWRWAAAAAMAAVVAVTGFWLLRQIERPGFNMAAAAPVNRFQIDYVNVGGAPAQTFVYQPQGTDTVFVWATRNP
jgi:hypothetical protein